MDLSLVEERFDKLPHLTLVSDLEAARELQVLNGLHEKLLKRLFLVNNAGGGAEIQRDVEAK